MKNGTISVIVPIYNVEPYLHKCVDSILTQTYTNLEIILVDDGSPDNCGAICDEYAQKDERVKVIHKENGGVSLARNAGLDAATGEYIAFIDADDYVPKDYFERLYHEIIDGVDMVSCEMDLYLPNAEKLEPNHRKLHSTAVLDSLDPRNFKEYIYINACGVLFKRSIVEDLRFNIDYDFAEDALFYFNALKRSNKISHSTSTAYCYVQRPGSATHSTFSEKRYVEIYVWQDICRLYADNAEIKEILEAEYARKCHQILNIIRHANIEDAEMVRFLKNEIRRFLPQALKLKKQGILRTFLIRTGFLLDVFLPEKLYRFVMMSYYFLGNRKLYDKIKGRIL